MTQELIKFLKENKELLNQNTKESWEKIYKKISFSIAGEFTETILDAGINDPALILGYIPSEYLRYSEIQKYIIPKNVTSINSSAFRNCSRLTSVEIGDSVTDISYYMFFGCSSLTNVKIGNSVTSISVRAFDSCNGLTSIEIPESVVEIDPYAFSYCTSLKEIHYKGTKKNALTKLKVKNKMWREGSPIEKIICSDGEIILK